mmetsp:Transcript_67147/g.132221  ORF Transcript_67147/g.132221 Transcript_67147/m.132221 type:complete len:119 (-) Transcript_67147:801-1157(-)
MRRKRTATQIFEEFRPILKGKDTRPIQSALEKIVNRIRGHHCVSWRYGKLKLLISVMSGGHSNSVEKNTVNNINSLNATFLRRVHLSISPPAVTTTSAPVAALVKERLGPGVVASKAP